MRRPRTALIATILVAAPVASTVFAQQLPTGPPPQTRGADSAVDAMASSRSPRALLRNGLDYLEVGEFDRALPLLREAEPRRAELSVKEQKALDGGIADAQKGLRAAANAPGRRAKSTRRPGAMALATPAAGSRVYGPDPIQLTSGTYIQQPTTPGSGVILSPTPNPTTPGQLTPAPTSGSAAIASPPPPVISPPTAMMGPAVFGVSPRQEPVGVGDAALPPLPDTSASTAPTPPPEPIRDLATTPPEVAAPTTAAEAPPVAAPPGNPRGVMPVSEPYPNPAPVGIPEPRFARPYQMPAAAQPTPAPASSPEQPVRVAAETSTMPASADTPATAPTPSVEPAPAPAAETIPVPIPSQPPARVDPDLPTPPPAPESVTAPASASPSTMPESAPPASNPAPTARNPVQVISSRLSPEVQREVERIAERQDARARQNPGQQPFVPGPGAAMPGASPDLATSPDLSGSRLELPRAPSPTEARAIRPIPVPEEFVPLPPRQWAPTRKFWTAPATCHMPLYFQNAVLERYGQSAEQTLGPVGRFFSYPLDDPKQSNQRNYLLAPIAGAALFATQVAALPINVILDPPWEAEFDLGYYRPGDRIPPDTTYFPQWGVGPPFQGRRY